MKLEESFKFIYYFVGSNNILVQGAMASSSQNPIN